MPIPFPAGRHRGRVSPAVVVAALASAGLCSPGRASADEPAAATPGRVLAGKAVAAAGGADRRLTLFRMEERYNAGTERVLPGTARVSVIEPPDSWWIGTGERGAEPAKTVAWAWTLGVLVDPRSQLAPIPDLTDDGKPLAGLRVTGSVEPALDMYFDQETHRLLRVDWRNDIYRFSDYRDLDGTAYPATCVMFRRSSGVPWFFHEILSIERLDSLPAGLTR